LLALGILALLGLMAEGAMADWSAVYLHDTLGASPAVAAIGFAAFSLAMAAGRLSGDALVGRLGPPRVLRGSSAVAAFGLALALLVGRPAIAIVGCALVGVGVANIIPILFSAAARVPGVPPGRALAAVATTGYLGFLAGPPLIGVVAEAAGLAAGLALVSGACAIIALKARCRSLRHVVLVSCFRQQAGGVTLTTCVVQNAAQRTEMHSPRERCREGSQKPWTDLRDEVDATPGLRGYARRPLRP